MVLQPPTHLHVPGGPIVSIVKTSTMVLQHSLPMWCIGRIEGFNCEGINYGIATGTLPNSVTRAVVQSSLGLAEVSPANAPGHLVVIIR